MSKQDRKGPWLSLIALIGVLVPQRLRADWRQEWEAELHYRQTLLDKWSQLNWRTKVELLWHSAGAFIDALWLQPQRWEDEMIQDVRYGARMLLKRPGLTLTAVVTLALGIGASLTIFSFVDTFFFRPLPVREPYQLVQMGATNGAGVAYPIYAHFRDHSKSFETLAAHYSTAPLNVAIADQPRVMNGAVVSANYFPMLGIDPLLGRFFLPEEDAVPDRDRVVVISHAMWQNNFSGDSSVLGKQIRINGIDFTIIGVTPKDFQGVLAGYPNDLWIPTMMLRVGYRWCDAIADPGCDPLGLLGRLAANHPLANAQIESTMLLGQLATVSSETVERGIRLDPALGVRVQDRERLQFQMRLMIAVTGLLLLIACANVTGLLLTQAVARRKEIAVRLSIGAGRVRLVRQFLIESLLLTLAGGALALLISIWLKQLLLGYYTTSYTTFRINYDLSLNARTFAYAVALTIVVGFLFGLPPALQATRHDLVHALKDGGISQGSGGNRLRSGLVVGQVALSLALLVSASLLIRSAINVRHGANFDPQHVLAMRLRPVLVSYDPKKSQAFTQAVVRSLEATTGVQSVSLATGSGLAWKSSGTVGVRLPEQVPTSREDQLQVEYHEIAPHFFDTLKIPLVHGRDFNDADRTGSPLVAVVNETLARRMWPDGSALERVLIVKDQPHQVVGVFKDSQFRNSDQGPLPFLYLASLQNNKTMIDSRLVVRVVGDPRTMLPILRRQINGVDPNVPISEDVPLTQQLDAEHRPVLLSSAVLTWSGALALFLSMIGLYGVLAFAISQRTREIGVRMALGAQTFDVLKLVVGQGLKLAIAGVLIGLLSAFAATRLIKSLLYGVGATDPLTFTAVVMVLVVVAFLACLIPARRAAKVDPIIALRYE